MGLDTALHRPEWSYRVPAAIAGLVSVLLVIALSLEVSGSVLAASVAGAAILTTGIFVEAARQVRLDVPVIASILFGAYCFARGMRDKRWLVGVGVAVAIGVMFKFVIGLLLAAYMISRAAFYRQWGWLREPNLWWGAAAGLILLAPWHLYESMQFGSAFWNGYLFHNVIDRMGGDILGGSMSLATFAKFLLVYTAPWSVVFVVSVLVMALWGKASQWEGRRRDIAVFAATALLISCVFAASSTRILYYILPALPFVAITVGLVAEEVRQRFGRTAVAAALVPLLLVGVWATSGVVTHRFTVLSVTDVIASDEAAAGRILAHNQEPDLVLTYQWPYWDTLAYYSEGRTIGGITDGQVVNESYYLIVHSEGNYSYPPAYRARLTELYRGPALTLYRFQYH